MGTGPYRSQSRDILLLDVVKAYFASYVLFLLCDCHLVGAQPGENRTLRDTQQVRGKIYLGAGGRANCFALGSETNLCQGSILVLLWSALGWRPAGKQRTTKGVEASEPRNRTLRVSRGSISFVAKRSAPCVRACL
eukprot:1561339-Rhodomonas_salina.2